MAPSKNAQCQNVVMIPVRNSIHSKEFKEKAIY